MKLSELFEAPERDFHKLMIQVRKGITGSELAKMLQDDYGIKLVILQDVNDHLESDTYMCDRGKFQLVSKTMTLHVQIPRGRGPRSLGEVLTTDIQGLDGILSHELIHNHQSNHLLDGDDGVAATFDDMKSVLNSDGHYSAYFVHALERPAWLHNISLDMIQNGVKPDVYFKAVQQTLTAALDIPGEKDYDSSEFKHDILGILAHNLGPVSSKQDGKHGDMLDAGAGYILGYISSTGENRAKLKGKFGAFKRLVHKKFKSIKAHHDDSKSKAYDAAGDDEDDWYHDD